MTNPAYLARIAALELENTNYMSELNRCWAELDFYRKGLEKFVDYPDAAVRTIAKQTLGRV